MEDKYKGQYFDETGSFWLSSTTNKPSIAYVKWLEKQLALCSVGSEAELLADKKQDFLEVCKDFVKWMDGYHKKQTKS